MNILTWQSINDTVAGKREKRREDAIDTRI
jgi:hypothetical protein